MVCYLLKWLPSNGVCVSLGFGLVCDSEGVTLIAGKLHLPLLGPIHQLLQVLLQDLTVFWASYGSVQETVIGKQTDC
jgi:hypothetical protein